MSSNEFDLEKFVQQLLVDCDGDVRSGLFHSEISPTRPQYCSDAEFKFRNKLETAAVSLAHEDSYGGEGQGEDFWSVYSFSNGDRTVYVKFDGWYRSYSGAYLDSWFFVEPKEKVVVVYEPTVAGSQHNQ